ncbi:MAG: dephospho-CoA kinase [Pseudomonadota bacterium]
MITLGLTGSIGMGKSTTANFFKEAGVPVHDADATVHALYEGEAVPLVAERFPSAIVDGKVDRSILGSLVVGNKAALRELEAIVHPLVRNREEMFLEKAQASGAPLVLLDIPLLFETGADKRVDKVLVVTAPESVQRQRVLSRPGMTEERLNTILAKQMPDEQKRAKADFIIDTSLGLQHARNAVVEVIRELKDAHQSS